MEIATDKHVLGEVEAFLVRANMAPSALGLAALQDGAVVFQMRQKKRSLTLRSAEKLLRFIAEYDLAETGEFS